MYTLLMLLLIALGVWLAVSGARGRRPGQVAAGAIVSLGTVFFFWFMGFWGEMLWFEALGYSGRFWRIFLVQLLAGAGGAVLASGCLYLLTIGYSREKRLARWAAVLLAGTLGISWGISSWEIILRFLHASPTEMKDPIFGRTVSFYLFTLPFLDSLRELLFKLAVISVAATVVDIYLVFNRNEPVRLSWPRNSGSAGRPCRAVGQLGAGPGLRDVFEALSPHVFRVWRRYRSRLGRCPYPPSRPGNHGGDNRPDGSDPVHSLAARALSAMAVAREA